MPEQTVIIGAGGHARVIADILYCLNIPLLGFLDDDDAVRFPGQNILGRVGDAHHFFDQAWFIIGIGRNALRETIAIDYASKARFLTAVHPNAVVAKSAVLGIGTVVMAGAVVNPGAVIGKHVIINTAATVDHDCVLEDYVHLSPGVHLSGTVHVGKRCWLGTGSVVVNNVSLAPDCVVGAGAAVVENLTKSGVYVGVPARKAGRDA